VDTGVVTVTPVAEGLEVVWDIEPVSDTKMFVLERPGRVRIFENGQLASATYATVPEIATGGQGGLLDLALAPDYATSKRVFLSYTVRGGGGERLRIARFRDTGQTLQFEQTIFEGTEKEDPAHFGGRMAFGRDGKLYVTHGERHDKELAQDANQFNGKVLRMNPDGTPPSDNPLFAQGGNARFVWTLGHRNPQGLAVDPRSGAVAVSEHGPSNYDAPHGYDEVNVLTKAANYGWPVIWGDKAQSGMRVADYVWVEATAPGGLAFRNGDLFVPMLAGEALWRLRMANGSVSSAEKIVGSEHGRLRSIGVSPDGTLYIGTSNGQDGQKVDRILKVTL